jgi:DNA-binding NtrC family response regulator
MRDASRLTLVDARPAGRPAHDSPLVLLATGDGAVLLSVQSSFRTYGYEVICGGRLQETVHQIRNRPVSVLVVDLDSEAEERHALVRAARHADPTLPVIYTVHGLARLAPEERVAGAPCLRSPYHPHQLLNLVRQLVRRARDEGEPHAA